MYPHYYKDNMQKIKNMKKERNIKKNDKIIK